MTAMNRRAGKRDIAEGPIKAVLLFTGECSVQTLSEHNAPDVIVGRAGLNILLEIKTGKGKLREGQSDFAAAWKGQTGVARTPYQALLLVGYSEEDTADILKRFEAIQEVERLKEHTRLERKRARLAKKV